MRTGRASLRVAGARSPAPGPGAARRRRSRPTPALLAAAFPAGSLAFSLALSPVAGGCAGRALPDIPVVPLDGWAYAAARAPTPGADLPPADAENLAEAWLLVRDGRLGEAQPLLDGLLERAGRDPGVLAAAGYAALRGGRPRAADERFTEALAADSGDAFAALGNYLAAVSAGDPDRAFDSLRRLGEIEPGAPAARERLPALTLETAERRLAAARDLARRDGTNPEVAAAYLAALEAVPESDDLRMEAAEAAAAAGERDAAADLYEAVTGSGTASERQVAAAGIAAAELLAASGRLRESAAVFDRVRSLGEVARDAGLARRAAALEPRLRTADLPAEYARIREAERVTRAQLAALLAAELAPPRPEGGSDEAPFIAIDLGRTWAADLIRRAVNAGYLTLFPDHTFKPRAFVNRATLAEALVAALAVHDGEALRETRRRAASRRFGDLPEMHRSREAAAVAVELGLLRAGDGHFRPRDFASGADAVRAVNALRALLEGAGEADDSGQPRTET